MEENIYLTRLYDYYGVLLTDKQQSYFTDYYMENLSITEISENYGISRNAAHKQIKEAVKNLIEYEKKLKLSEKGLQIEQILKKLDNERIKNSILELI